MSKLNLNAVFTDERRLALLEAPDLLHLRVAVVAVNPGTRTAGTIRDDDPAEPFIALSKTLRDSVIRHDLDIVLVRRHT